MVRFYETSEVDDALLKFAVIVTKTGGKWVFCKHKERDSFTVYQTKDEKYGNKEIVGSRLVGCLFPLEKLRRGGVKRN